MSNQKNILDIIIIGAGPAGISVAVEAVHHGVGTDKILLLEKANTHSWSIRKFYPDEKLVTANYKGVEAECKGVMCLLDQSKSETLSYLDQAIENHRLKVHYQEEAFSLHKDAQGVFHLETNKGKYQTRICVIAIGVLGRPNRPDYPIPAELKKQVSFDVTSQKIENKSVLVIGGGDSASEYCQYLVQKENQVSLSYRKEKFSRMNSLNLESLEALESEKKLQVLRKTDIEKLEQEQEKIRVHFKDNQHSLVFDHLVYALGGSTPENFLESMGIAFTKDASNLSFAHESKIHGLYLVGDLSSGKKGGSINLAFNSAKESIEDICFNYLECRSK